MKKEKKMPEREETCFEQELVVDRNIKPEVEGEQLSTAQGATAQAQETAEEQQLSPEALIGQQLVHLETALAETKDQLLRTAAEYDNFRKRTVREKEQLYTDSVQDVVLAWLPLVDNLDRALNAAKLVSGADEEVVKGVEMIQRQAYAILEQLQVEEIAALGEVFDPSLHHAVMQIEDDSYGSQEIVEVLQKGYKRGDRVLRAAVVKVANC